MQVKLIVCECDKLFGQTYFEWFWVLTLQVTIILILILILIIQVMVAASNFAVVSTHISSWLK